MRVLCVTSLFPDRHRPNFAIFNYYQMTYLARMNVVELLVPTPITYWILQLLKGRGIEPPEGLEDSLRIRYLRYFYTPRILRSLYGTFYYLSIRSVFNSVVREFKPQVVYVTWGYPDCYAVVKAAKKYGLPVVLRFHGSDINEHFKYPNRKMKIIEAIGGSKKVIVVSEEMRNRLVEEGIYRDKVCVVYNGVDTDIFHPIDKGRARNELNLSMDKKIILFVGNLVKVKGVDVLVKATALLKVPDVEVHIIGDGPLKNALISKIQRLNIEDRIFLHGSVAHSMIPVWLSASDFLCLPSRSEGLPNVVLEAIACSVPVVASDVGGIHEIVNKESGILFPPDSEFECARAMEQALLKRWDREKIGGNVSSWFRNAEEVSKVLQAAVK